MLEKITGGVDDLASTHFDWQQTDVLSFGLAFLAALVLTGIIRGYALKRSLLDLPNHRSSHTVPTPRGGGLAIAISFVGTLLFMHWPEVIKGSPWLALVSGGVLVVVVGWVDDCGHLAPAVRIASHVLAVLIGLYWLQGIPPLAVALWVVPAGVILNCVAGVCLVWLLNLFNFMDGIDGLAAMEATFVALGAAVIVLCLSGWGQEAATLILFALSCLGFLVWNWPPARIFMGDAGSGFLGYTLGILLIMTLKSGVLTLPAWLILLAAFGVDATLTLIGRMANGENWWAPHCRHAYQTAARRYGSHRAVTLRVLAINILWLLPLAFLATAKPRFGWLLVLIAVAPLVFLVLRERSWPGKSAGSNYRTCPQR